MKRAAGGLACLALFAGAAIAADEDKDLELIPRVEKPATTETIAPPADSVGQRIYLENALEFTSLRDGLLVPFPPPLPPRWQERLFGDARVQWPLGSGAFIAYSGRLNLLAEEDLGFPNRGNVTHDLRELYASFEPETRDYLDMGRINVKSGVALGFNPTDFLKARAVVDPLTADPRALREDRLGAMMFRAQRVGEAASIAALYAPKLTDPAPIATDPYRGFSPLFGRTNSTNRWLVKGSVQLGDGMNPEALLFGEEGHVKIGANITESVGQATVVYLEWSGGRQTGIIDQAFAFGMKTGAIPSTAAGLITQGGDERFRSQLAIGASYTTETKITFNLEYHYNASGFSRSDWDHWFALGEGRPESSPVSRALWYIRGYAADQQQPIQQHSIFLRADWVDFLVPKLELTGFVLADASDGSTLMQIEADYAHTDNWTFGALANATTGGRRSNFGSLPQGASLLLKATRYF